MRPSILVSTFTCLIPTNRWDQFPRSGSDVSTTVGTRDMDHHLSCIGRMATTGERVSVGAGSSKQRPHSWHSSTQTLSRVGSRRMDGLRALDVMSLLQERLAVLTGGRDRRGGPVLSFPATPRRERAKPDDYRRLLQYLLAIP
uniref:Uncharacterized protein n=1 Tax=Timema tahoe TaxID=61484 RepID=A0A7R9FGV5_9NEOP|nr:unnamed protein product [Timema tahoe]